MASLNLGRVGLVLRGDWSATTNYVPLDVVTYNGNSFAAKAASINTLPTNTTYWQPLAQNSEYIAQMEEYLAQAQEYAETAEESSEAAAKALANQADVYSNQSTYSAGDYVLYEGVLYRCLNPITAPENWTPANWETIKFGGALPPLQNDTNNLKNDIGTPFSTTADYSSGDFVMYNGILYRFTESHPAGAWTGEDVSQVSIAGDFLPRNAINIDNHTLSIDTDESSGEGNSYLDKVIFNGLEYDIRDSEGREMIAPEETSSTASRAYAVGEVFVYNNLLYRATAAIAQGGTITPRTNCQAVPGGLGGEVSDLKSAMSTDVTYSPITNWSIGGLTDNMKSTNTSANRARIKGAYLPEIPNAYNVVIPVPSGYAQRVAVYSSRAFSSIITILTGDNFVQDDVVIPSEYSGKYIGMVIKKTDNADFTDDEITALSTLYKFTTQSVIGDMSALEPQTLAGAIGEIDGRLSRVAYDWDDFATVTYPTGWRVGSWTSTGAHNTGVGNAIHLIRMLTMTDMIGVKRIKFEWTGAYTMSVKLFLRSAPTTLYAWYVITSGTVLNINPALDAFYGITLVGFGTGAQTALDNGYPDNIIITKILDASDGIAKRFKNRDSEFFTVPVSSAYPSGDPDSSGTVNVDCVLRLPSGYSPTGNPTKLIFMHHGNSGTVNVEDETWYSESNVWINFVNAYLDAGYAVFDVNGCGPVSDPNASHDYAAFGALEAAFKAYQYIVANYNINPNILVHGSSMGGATAYAFAKAYGGIVDAIGLFSPALLSRSAQMDSVDDYIAVNYGYADVAAMIADGYSRLILSNPHIEYLQNGARIDKAYTYDWVNEHIVDGLDIVCTDIRVPIKIWCGTADTSVDPKYGDELAKAIVNGGGFALFRAVQDGTHRAGLGGDATVNSEAVMWFNRFK